MPVSWKYEVIADSSGQWCGNAVRFATKAEADAAGRAKMWAWLAVRDVRTVESDDPPNYRWTDNGLEEIPAEAPPEEPAPPCPPPAVDFLRRYSQPR